MCVWGGGGNFTPCWFSLNNGKSCYSWHFIRNFQAKFDIPNLSQSPDIGQNLGSISVFWFSGQSIIKENCHNSRNSDDIEMKLGPATKLNKKNKTASRNFDDDAMSANCDVIVFFPIYSQFGATRKPDSSRIVCETYIFINSNLSYKN